MQIKINKNGNLEIVRAGQYKLQYCPSQANNIPCGDWCPLFGEPDMNSGYAILNLCKRAYTIRARNFKDERKAGGNNEFE